MECWSTGVLERSPIRSFSISQLIQYSTTPLLHYSNTPIILLKSSQILHQHIIYQVPGVLFDDIRFHRMNIFRPGGAVFVLGHGPQGKSVLLRQNFSVNPVGQKNLV